MWNIKKNKKFKAFRWKFAFLQSKEKGKFELNGETYTLATNNGENHLHGGNVGFDKVLWNVEEICNGVKFTHTSKDGEEGYPGTVEIAVSYKLAAIAISVGISKSTIDDFKKANWISRNSSQSKT